MKNAKMIVLIMVVCFLFFQNLIIKTVFSLDTQIPTVSASHSKLLFLNQEYLCHLNTFNRQISIYNLQMQRLHQWSIPTPDPSIASELTALSLLNEKVLILDASQAKIMIFRLNGTPLGYLQGAATFLQHPTAMTVMKDTIYIAQDRFIWALDDHGYLLNVQEFAPSSTQPLPWITHMTSDGQYLYLSDQMNHVLHYGFNSFKKRGSFGSKQGQFLAFAGLAVNGNWIVSDALTGKVQLFHPAYESWNELSELVQVPSKPLSLAINDKSLYMTSHLSDEIKVIPLNNLRQSPSAMLSVKEIDLGNNVTANDTAFFSVVSSNGFPIQGKVTCPHPGITIRTPHFKGSINPISFSLNADKIAMNSSIQTQITVILDEGESHQLDLRFLRNDQAGIKLGSTEWSKITDTQPEIKLYVYSQNDLEGTFDIGIKDLSDSFDLSLDRPKLDLNKNRINSLVVSAIAKKNIPSGLYPFQLTLRSNELKIQRQYIRHIAFAPSEVSAGKTHMAELFTVTWCPYCPSAEKGLKQLDSHYSNDKLLLLSYYLVCKDEGSDALCSDFGQERAFYYDATGIPVFFVDGISRKDGGIANLEDSMLEAYDAMVKERIHLRAPLSLNAIATFDDELNSLKVMIQGKLLQNYENATNLRLFSALAEKEVLFVGKNKKEQHHHVARWMHASQGQELILKDGSAFSKKGQVVELSFDIPSEAIPQGEWQLLSWIQDMDSKEIIQSTLVPLTQKSSDFFRWKQEEVSVSWNPQQAQSQRFILSHFGEGIGVYQLKPLYSEAYDILPEQWSILINGVVHPFKEQYDVNLTPGQSLEFTFSSASLEKVPESIGVRAINTRSKEEKTSIARISSKLPQESCKVEVLYPRPNSVVDVSSLYLLLKTGADTRLIAPASARYLQENSLIAVPVSLYAGNNQIKLSLECSNGEKTEINLHIRYLMSIQLHIGNLEARHNRNTVQLDAVPFIREARTMVPLRFIAEAFGASVLYDASEKTVTIQYMDQEIVFFPNSKKVSVNGKIIELDVSTVIVNQRTFFPLRFVSEQFGAQVTWEADTQGISIEVK
jgi:hypothetical protein